MDPKTRLKQGSSMQNKSHSGNECRLPSHFASHSRALSRNVTRRSPDDVDDVDDVVVVVVTSLLFDVSGLLLASSAETTTALQHANTDNAHKTLIINNTNTKCNKI
jgi:hypothetical protein